MTAPFPPSSNGTPSVAQSSLEGTLEQLLQSLLELGICASDVQESALETSTDGAGSGYPGGLAGRKAAQTIEHLAELYAQKDSVAGVNIPLDVINFVDQGKNPHLYTKDFIERVAGENMYTNGILSAVTDYRDMLDAQLAEAFPELADVLKSRSNPAAAPSANGHTSTSVHVAQQNGDQKMEE